ncbi:MAG TPA: hypothetical protein VFY74_07385 [Methyloceanibacter sp.]|jgi:uncharacterized protein YfiM (DUF2279 family)|nr:hypothetical protein [Methyloceanibacter sp.]
MGSDRRGEPHLHVTLVATDRAATSMHRPSAAGAGFSLLRLSLAERLIIAAAASGLLWGAVFWALR